MYHVSAQGVDERMINVHYYYYYISHSLTLSVSVFVALSLCLSVCLSVSLSIQLLCSLVSSSIFSRLQVFSSFSSSFRRRLTGSLSLSDRMLLVSGPVVFRGFVFCFFPSVSFFVNV